MKALGVILFILLFALNALTGAAFSDAAAEKSFDDVNGSNFVVQPADDSNQCYALQPSVQYNSIDKSRDRRKNKLLSNLCFASAGALGVLAVVFLNRFYEIFVSRDDSILERLDWPLISQPTSSVKILSVHLRI